MFNKLKSLFVVKYFYVIVLLVLLDQVSKWYIKTNFLLHQSKQLTSFLAITYVTNTGISFGLFEGNNLFFIIVISGVLVFLILSSEKIIRDFGEGTELALLLIVSGGIGNLLDRVFVGKVIDFIDLQMNYKNIWPVFNFADSYVFIGMSFLVLKYLLSKVKLKGER